MIDQTAQRTMQVPGQGIIPQGRPVMDHKEYPKMMTHPAYQPGKPGPEVKSPHGFTYHVGGEPIRFPPVLVRTPDQEEYHRAQGYETVGKSDPDAFARAVGAGQIPDHVAYKPLEYPKWVQGKLCQSKEEEDRLFPPSEVLVDPGLNVEVDPGHYAGKAPSKTAEQLRIEDLEGKVLRLTDLLAQALEGRPLAVEEYTERYVKTAPKKAASKKAARKMPVLSAAQKQSRSDAIKAGLARKRALTASVAVDDVPESQR